MLCSLVPKLRSGTGTQIWLRVLGVRPLTSFPEDPGPNTFILSIIEGRDGNRIWIGYSRDKVPDCHLQDPRPDINLRH